MDYEVIHDFIKPPPGQSFGLISRVAADDQDRIYVFQRQDPPVVVYDRDGKYLGASRDDAQLILSRDPSLTGERGQARWQLLDRGGKDQAITLIRAG